MYITIGDKHFLFNQEAVCKLNEILAQCPLYRYEFNDKTKQYEYVPQNAIGQVTPETSYRWTITPAV